MEEDMLPAKKQKVELGNEIQGSHLQDNQQQNQQTKVYIAQSPITEPMLMPEMWSKIFEYMSPDELQILINTTPEWNRLLHSQKPKILFPKVLACMRGILSRKDILSFRMVSKAGMIGVETAYPEIIRVILIQEEMARAMQIILVRVRLGMRHEARNREREAQGLPMLAHCEDDEEQVVPEDEFSVEEIQAYLT